MPPAGRTDGEGHRLRGLAQTPELRWLDRPPVRRVFGEGEVGPGTVIVLEVPGEDVSQVALAQDEDIVETLSPDRADEAFREGVLPRTSGSSEDFFDPHALHTLTEGVTVDGVAVAKDRKGRCRRERSPRSAEQSTPRWDAR